MLWWSLPGQELFGEMPGYFGDRRDSRKWLITDADIEGKTAHLSIINDYGSEDMKSTGLMRKIMPTPIYGYILEN